MKAMDLLDSFGQVRDSYVVQAGQFREGKQAPQTKRLSLRRPLLVAAIVALTLLLVGCAVVYMLSLQDLKLGEEIREDSRTGTTEVRQVLSLQGVVGTPGYLASKEWYEWEQAYDPDMEIYHSDEAFSEDFGEEYYAYNLYSREMKEKVDEICEKYGLELLGRAYTDTDIEETFRAMGIPGIFKQDAPVQTGRLGHYYYENGSFKVEGNVTLTGENNPWPHETMISFRCNRKDAFGDLYDTIGPVGTYEEWNYTTSDGVDVLMLLDEKNATMMVDKGEYFFVVGADVHAGNALDGEYTMDRAGLEAFAEVFDFTIQPHRVSPEVIDAAEQRVETEHAQHEEEIRQMQARLDEYHGIASYEARVKYHLENDPFAEQLGFTLLDLDGNGTEELIIGRDGYIYYIYAEKDGQTSEIKGLSSYFCYLADDGTIVGEDKFLDISSSYFFFHVEDGEMVMDKRQIYHSANEYDEEGGEVWQADTGYSPITREEFDRNVNSKKRVVLEMLPLTQYPLSEGVKIEKNAVYPFPEGVDSYADLVRQKILLLPSEVDYRNPPADMDQRYALIDLNGDGQEELFWDGVSSKQIYAMGDGEVMQVLDSGGTKLCSGNVIEVTRSFSGENKVYCYYRMEGMDFTMIDYLRYDADKDPENPWFRSSDASGQDVSMEPISMEEFNAILSGYVPLNIEMKPMDEFPLS